MAKWSRRMFILLSVLLILIPSVVYFLLRMSLPDLDGVKTVSGIKANIEIHRDMQGVPVITGSNRSDIAYATGYIHAQERFFQMDLNRRNSAGELSELFGVIGLEHDKNVRKHSFRRIAQQVMARLPEEQKKIIEAYTKGVNQGLFNLGSRPFEYLLLKSKPTLWEAEDCFLAVFSMYLDLNDNEAELDDLKGFLRDIVPESAISFLNPLYSRWDAPLQEGELAKPILPGSEIIDLRRFKSEQFTDLTGTLKEDVLFGSNSMAVSGLLAKGGKAIIENDMHLNLRVPVIWFRAQFNYPHPEFTDKKVKITGVTLPGTPFIVVGSNGNIAWSFTNSYGDWTDLVELRMTNDQYETKEGMQTITVREEVIKIKGADPETIVIPYTKWGPVISSKYDDKYYALRWTAHSPEATNANLARLETAETISDAVAIANISGLPPQNFVVGDSEGNIAWTIAGKVPDRSGVDSTYPLSFEQADKHWAEWLSADHYPKVVKPESGRLWTANARVVGAQDLEKIGDGGYALGARQHQIRNALFNQNEFDEEDLLDIALDDQAIYMGSYRDLILEVLTEEARAEHSSRQLFYNYVKNWQGRASTTDVGYRLVREYHDQLRLVILQSLGRYFLLQAKQSAKNLDDTYLQTLSQDLEMINRLVEERPINWLNPEYASWETLFLDSIDRTIDKLGGEQKLSESSWSKRNVASIRHPLSHAIPVLGWFLDMPSLALEGDTWMPRIQQPSFGASERMVVSPGREEAGIFHMPGGQSGHPLSPFYKMGYMDWVEGRSSPFLPGNAKYKLVLTNSDG